MKGVKDGEQCSIKRGGKKKKEGKGQGDATGVRKSNVIRWGGVGGVGAQSRESLSHRLKVTQRRKHSI